MATSEPAIETVLALPTPLSAIRPATDIRGTILVTSLGMAREHGLEAKYFEHLPVEYHERVRNTDPSTWVPMEVVLPHYRTMTHLFPDEKQQVENGRISSERTQNGYLRTVVRTLQAAGQVSPLSGLKRMPAVLARMLQGGGACGVYKTGPKDARIELVAYPLLEGTYVRNGWQGMFESGLSLMAKRVYLRQDKSFRGAHNAAYDIAWV